MRALQIQLIVLLLYSNILVANENKNELIDLIDNELDLYSKIATTTKQNEHYQPYIISILDGTTMEKLGFTTLEEAIKLIPGVDIKGDNVNNKIAIFRGSNPISYGQSKLFIDGILVNNIYFDGYSEYLDMPIELIKRIEVTRGPGNENNSVPSYAGSINIITYAEEGTKRDNLVFTKFGSNNYQSIGFRKKFLISDFSFFTDFYYQKHDNSVHIDSDSFKSGLYNFKTPYYNIDNTFLSSESNIPIWLKNYSLGLCVTYKNFTLNGRVNYYKQGSAFGLNYIPAKKDDTFETPNHYLQLQYQKEFNQFQLDSRIGVNYNSMQSDAKLLSDGITLPKMSNFAEKTTFIDGISGINKAKQKNIYNSTNINYFGIEKHKLNIGYNISQTKTYKITSKITNRDTGIGIVDYSSTLPFFDISAFRETYLFTIQDKYDYTDSLQFLTSLGYEHNTNAGHYLEPKLSMVYRKDSGDIFKILYSSSHRSPSWQELYTINNHARVGNKNLKPEKIQTLESSYIKQLSNNRFIQTTLFYLMNQDQIHNNTNNNQYINSNKNNDLQGIELEYKGYITPKDSLYLNMSYIDGENSYDQTLSLVSQFLVKGYYIYDINNNISLSTVAKYSSSKNRLSEDKRDKLDSTTIIDTTLNYKNHKHDYKLSFSIKNIFDTDTYYSAKPNTYEDDYPQVGRNFILSFSKKF
jgi:iron complex outermembrane receptor protein